MATRKLIDILGNFTPYKNSKATKECVNAFEDLLNTYNIPINNLPKLEASNVIQWGLPLSFIDKKCFADLLLEKIAKSFVKKGTPKESDLAELQAIALLLSLGATSGNKIPIYNNKAHDFNVKWSNMTIEVEVTKANTKEAHILRTNQARGICERLFSLEKPFDIYVYIPDLIKDEMKKKLLQAASKIKCNEVISENHHWQIKARKIDRDVYVLYKVGGA